MFLLNHKLGQSHTMSTASQQTLPGKKNYLKCKFFSKCFFILGRIADLDSPVGPISPNQNGFPFTRLLILLQFLQCALQVFVR